MSLIAPEQLPARLDPTWVARCRKAIRVLFWTILITPFLTSFTEFWVRVVMPLVGAESAGETAILWNQWLPPFQLLGGIIAFVAFTKLTTSSEGFSEGERRAKWVRSLGMAWVALLTVRALESMSLLYLNQALVFWGESLVWTLAAVAALRYLAVLAERLEQIPLKLIADVMAVYVVGRLGVRILMFLIAGTDAGKIMNPVLAMSDLAFGLVTMGGFLLVSGKLHRVFREASGRSAAKSASPEG